MWFFNKITDMESIYNIIFLGTNSEQLGKKIKSPFTIASKSMKFLEFSCKNARLLKLKFYLKIV